jgi:hypothetical protein
MTTMTMTTMTRIATGIQVPIMAIPETYLLMIPEFLVRICIALNVLLIATVSR